MIIVKAILITLIIILSLWVLSTMINHSLVKENQRLYSTIKANLTALDAFMSILRLIKKNLNYTTFKYCPSEEIENIIAEVITMIEETERAYEGGKNGLHK